VRSTILQFDEMLEMLKKMNAAKKLDNKFIQKVIVSVFKLI